MAGASTTCFACRVVALIDWWGRAINNTYITTLLPDLRSLLTVIAEADCEQARPEVVRDVDGVDDAERVEPADASLRRPELVHAPETIGSRSNRLELCRVLGGVAAVIEDAVHALGGVAAEGDRVLGPLRVGGVRPSSRARGLEVAAVLLVAVLDPGVVREGERPAAARVLALEAFLRQVVVRL